MKLMISAAACILLVGCGPQSKPSSSSPAPTAEAPSAEAPSAEASADLCADGGGRLAGTGLCQADAAALLASDPNLRTPELATSVEDGAERCTWAVRELMLPDGEALLYNAAACNGVETILGYAGGAHRAEIFYESSAVHGAAAQGRVVAHLYGTDPDPQGALKAAIAEAPADERENCEIRPANREGWPADALLIAPTASARAALPADQPVIACGPMGIDETKVRYWRVRQGFAWFFDLGTEDPDFVAGSMAVVVKAPDGAWRPKT